MCGIAGWVNWPREDAHALLGRVLAALAHRGPDAEGQRFGRDWALGARRLAVIDLATGDQPVSNEDGTVHAVFNGEIYNYRELRQRLIRAGHWLRSEGDSEVLVHLWEDEGPAMVSSLRGMFAFAVVDAGRGTLFLARDRVGKKPLYWTRHQGGLLFASELKALRSLGELQWELDAGALHDYLRWGFVPEGGCIYAGVSKLPPGHVLSLPLAGGEPTVERYWRLAFSPDSAVSFDEAREAVTGALAEAVRLRLRADVPLAVFLSGGLDSGIVTALAAREQSSLRAVTVSFAGERGELELARATAGHVGVELEELEVDPGAGIALLPRLAEVFDEPLADASVIPTYLIAERARSRATVVLNGDGGDEALAGYRRYLVARAAELPGYGLWRGPAALAAGAAGLVGLVPRSRVVRLRHALRSSSGAYDALGPVKLTADEVARLLPGVPGRKAETSWPAGEHGPVGSVNAMRALDTELFLPGDLLVKMDRATMACSLEARSPFLDHRVLELTATVPSRLLLRGMRTKALLRAVADTLLPGTVAQAPKRGFEAPLQSWLSGPWAGQVRSVLGDPEARVRQLLDERELARWRTWTRHGDPQRAARAVFTLVTLEHWLQRWM